MKINDSTIAVAKMLRVGAYKACVVGEAALDLALHGEIKTRKIELATNAMVSELSVLFTTDSEKYTILYTSHTMLVLRYMESDTYFQINTFTKLTPSGAITPTDSVEPYLLFKNINVLSMAYDLHTKKLIDPFNVQQDIEDKVIKVNREEAFNNELTLPFKVAFLCASLGFKLDGKSAAQMSKNSHLVSIASGSNVQNAMDKFFTDLRYPSIALRILYRTNILSRILPELAAANGYKITYLDYNDLYQHTLKTIDVMPMGRPKARWAALFHDLGKLKCCENYGTVSVRFDGFEEKSAETALQIMSRLSFGRKDMMDIVRIVRTEVNTYRSAEEGVLGYVRSVGANNVNDSLMLEAGHRVLKGAYGMESTKNWIGMYKRRIHYLRVRDNQFVITDLVVNGYDLMKWFNIEQGPIIGEVLNNLFKVVKGDIFSNNITLLKRVAIRYFDRLNEKSA